MEFEWDSNKAARNRSKHGLSFDEAADVFSDAPIIVFDDIHSADEERSSSPMAKIKHRSVKFSPEEMEFELPFELNLKRMRGVGRGLKP